MAKLEDITVEVHATDIAMHDVFKEIANKIYHESGIMVRHISFDWYTDVFGNNAALMGIDIDSTKR